MRTLLFIRLFYTFAVAYPHGFNVFARTGIHRQGSSFGLLDVLGLCVVGNYVLNVVCDSVKKKEKYIKVVSY